MDTKELNRKDELWMEEALREASRAQANDEVPVGAVILHENKIIGRGYNRNRMDSDPSAHAEIVALREAGQTLGNYRLEGCQMLVTIEPCAMCCGALVHARLARLVYGADDPKAGAVRSILQIINHPQLNHHMEIVSGVLAGKCAQIMQAFFQQKRGS